MAVQQSIEVKVKRAGSDGTEVGVRWFRGSSVSSIKSSIASALDIPAGCQIVAREKSGAVVALSSGLPGGLTLEIHALDLAPSPPPLSLGACPPVAAHTHPCHTFREQAPHSALSSLLSAPPLTPLSEYGSPRIHIILVFSDRSYHAAVPSTHSSF